MAQLLTIGDFAREAGLTPKALRLYDELDLLAPAEVDPWNGYRRYARDQLGRARLVATLRLVGMPLARIRSVLDLPPAQLVAEITAYWRQVEADLASRRNVMRSLVQRLQSEETTMPSTPSTFRAVTATSTRQGERRRQQDAVFVGTDVFGVADGFGVGDVAATVLEEFASNGFPAAVHAVPGNQDTGATLTAVRIAGARAVVTHVGDSRAYLVRDGRVERLTHDHTMVAALIEAGELTEDEASGHPHRAVLNRALDGRRDVAADTREIDLQDGDRLALTTDGVHAVLTAADLAALIVDNADPQTAADAISTAVRHGGEPDNHSTVIVDLHH